MLGAQVLPVEGYTCLKDDVEYTPLTHPKVKINNRLQEAKSKKKEEEKVSKKNSRNKLQLKWNDKKGIK